MNPDTACADTADTTVKPFDSTFLVSFSLYDASSASYSLLLEDDLVVFDPPATSTPTKPGCRPRPPPAVPAGTIHLPPANPINIYHHDTLPKSNVKVGLTNSQKRSRALLIGPIEYSSYVRDLWPHSTGVANRSNPIHMDIYQKVRSTNLPNYMSARIPIPSDLKCDAWDHLLQNYHDQEITQFLRFGWPSSYTAPTPPTSTLRNHPSAFAHSSEVDRFIQKECSKGALLGPFDNPPFSPWSQVSPLMTAKKDSLRRRVIIDLSFPEGQSVNDGVARNFFQGIDKSYTLPTVHDLAQRIIALGPGTLIWKTDLERAYRQLRSDPLDYPLMGIFHKGEHFIDICPSFGCRGSSAAQQRVSTAVCHLMSLQGFYTLAYIDDFCGAHATYSEAVRAFATFESLCDTLGLQIAHDKSAFPSTTMEWLGFDFDTVLMQITIPEAKLKEVLALVDTWSTKTHANRRELQSLTGKLNHVALCILPARRFMARLLSTLRAAPQTGTIRIDEEARRDVTWFVRFAEASNGRYLLRPTLTKLCIECDACLEGGGRFFSI